MPTIASLYNSFMEDYNNYNQLISNSTILYQSKVEFNGTIYNKNIHDAVVEHCFMNTFLSWESFVEKSFIAYLKGEKDMKDTMPLKYGNPTSDDHAYEMLSGTKRYPDWTNIEEVKKLSHIYFDNSGPYQIFNTNPIEFQDIKAIRNKISHVSLQSQSAFERVLVKTIIKSSGITVCDFLMTMKGKGPDTYYSYYTDTLKTYVEIICNK